MRSLWLIALLLVASVASAQRSFLKETATKLDKALVEKDTVVLKQLLHDSLTYGHSNAWVQTKSDVVKDLSSGKFVYNRIDTRDTKWTVVNEVATARSSTDVSYQLEGKAGELKLHVVQVWLKTKRGWQLLTRQSTKLPLSP